MRLLIITQKVNKQDPVLGFFHRWIIEFAKHSNLLTVICLEKGEYDLPSHVKVLSLGKEKGVSRIKYILNFYTYIWRERKNYDAVFVHMNQEYVILGWKFWKLWGKKIFLWRNHAQGNFLTRIAVWVSDRVFCTSPHSFTAQFKKTEIVGAGIDEYVFKKNELVHDKSNNFLFLGRIAPVKKLEVLIDALHILHEKKLNFVLNVYGDALPQDMEYFSLMKQKASRLMDAGKVFFHGSIPHEKTPDIYRRHDLYINTTNSGSFDKTIIEAILSGCFVIASNRAFSEVIPEEFSFKEDDAKSLSVSLERYITNNTSNLKDVKEQQYAFASKHSLEKLCVDLFAYFINEK